MIGIEYNRIEVFTDEGRDPSAAEVVLTPDGNGFHVDVSAASKPLVKVVIHWKAATAEGTRILGDHW